MVHFREFFHTVSTRFTETCKCFHKCNIKTQRTRFSGDFIVVIVSVIVVSNLFPIQII